MPGQQAPGMKAAVVDPSDSLLAPVDLTSIDQMHFSNGIDHPSNSGYDQMAKVWFDADGALGIGPETLSHRINGFPAISGQTSLNEAPDGDGLHNGIESFFVAAPKAASPDIAIGSVNPVQGTFTFTHPQGVLADDLAFANQWSKDLQSFHGDLASDAAGTTVAFATQANAPGPSNTTATATVTGTPCDRLFLRAKVAGN